ncbi:hypothetical protein ABEB36_011789 [Hypothenemus hampei]
MDKRNQKTTRGKCLCWTVCLCIVSAALIIGILAAVGVIGNQSPMAPKEITARHFSGQETLVKGAAVFGSNPDDETTSPGPPSSTLANIPPHTDTSMIEVPRALESEITIDNMEFSEPLRNSSSSEYQTLAQSIENQLKKTLFTNDMLNYGSSDIEVKVMEFLPGSVIVKYRVAWRFKEGIHNARDPINKDVLDRRINNVLHRNHGIMESYRLADRSMDTKKIMDLCQIQNNGCQYKCLFDYMNKLDFVCQCPVGKILADNGKSCIEKDVEPDEEQSSSEVSPLQESSNKPSPSAEPVPLPEPTAEPLPSPEPGSLPEPTAEPAPLPESTAEPSPSPEPVALPEPTAEPAPLPEPTAESAPLPEPTAEPSSSPESVSIPEPTAEPVALPEPTAEPSPSPEPSALPEPTAEPAPLPQPAAEPSSSPKSAVISEPEPTTESKPSSNIAQSASGAPNDSMPVVLQSGSETTTQLITEPPVERQESRLLNHGTQTEESSESNFVPYFRNETEPVEDHDDEYHFVNEEATYLEPSTEKMTEHKTERLVEMSLKTYNDSELEMTTMIQATSSNLLTKERLKEMDSIKVVTPEAEIFILTSTSTSTEPPHQTVEHNISPFLPEIENDTLVNILHSDEHFVDHNQDADQNETKAPPTLINDQLNHTNPFDPHPTDVTSLGVLPLNEDNEINEESVSESRSYDTTDSSSTSESSSSSLNNSESSSEPNSDNTTISESTTESEANTESTTSQEDSVSSGSVNKESNATSREEVELSMTLPPEVFNNVHSNIYFEQALEVHDQPPNVTTTTTTTTTTTSTTSTTTTTMEPTEVTTTDEVTTVIATTTTDLPEYEVKEPSEADVTTTERLFLTKRPSVNEKEEDLSVMPLDSFNSISVEEQSVMDKFHPTIAPYEKIDNKDLFSTVANVTTPLTSSETIKPVTEDFRLFSFARCAIGEFQCTNGTSIQDGRYCVPAEDRCDSVIQCSDGSDEVGCADGCVNNFKCNDGKCLKRNRVCDGIANCNDASDETNCDTWACVNEEFSCGNASRCLPLSWKCDGKLQCANGDDERGCQSSALCPTHSFYCSEQQTCIADTRRCDGQIDCSSGEDESNCECPDDKFKCHMGGVCLDWPMRCDGVAQCPDRSDEWACLSLNSTDNILKVRNTNDSWTMVCLDENNWNTSDADTACQILGYSGSIQVKPVEKLYDNSTMEFYELQTQEGATFFGQLRKRNSCTKVATLYCQEFACGGGNEAGAPQARKIGGNKAATTQWPSLALLYNKNTNVQCTSTIVAPLWLIASYSCVVPQINGSDWMVYAGSTNIFAGDNSSTQLRDVADMVVHPQAKYTTYEYENDVVLVRVNQPFVLGRNVSTICLPDKEIEPRQLCVLSGWGINNPGDSNKEQYLHYLPVPLIESSICNSTKHYNGLLHQGKICAGYTDSDMTPCYNDEGAPLMCYSEPETRWELQGILSHHENCGLGRHPAIYSSINGKIKRWITETIGQALIKRAMT